MVTHRCTERETIERLRINEATMAQEIKAIKKKVEDIDEKIDDLPNKMKEIYVSKLEFEEHKITLKTIQKIVYGCVAIILISVIGAIISLILR